MREAVTAILPHQWDFGSGPARPTPTARKEFLERRGSLKAGAIGNVNRGKRSKEFGVTDHVPRVELGKRLLP